MLRPRLHSRWISVTSWESEEKEWETWNWEWWSNGTRVLPVVSHIFLKNKLGVLFFIFKDFIYVFMRDTQSERQRHRQREKQAPCREPDMGLYPGLQDQDPELQAALNHWATGAAQWNSVDVWTVIKEMKGAICKCEERAIQAVVTPSEKTLE